MQLHYELINTHTDHLYVVLMLDKNSNILIKTKISKITKGFTNPYFYH